MSALKRILLGQPISSADEAHQRLSKKVALPVFASDAISSTAYATDEILVVLLLQAGIGAAAFDYLVPIAVVVCVLLVIVVISYRQTIMAYPSGGGAYIVSRENLGRTPSLVAASALHAPPHAHSVGNSWATRGLETRPDQHFRGSRVRESNPRPHDYKSSALPTELTRRDMTSDQGLRGQSCYPMVPQRPRTRAARRRVPLLAADDPAEVDGVAAELGITA